MVTANKNREQSMVSITEAAQGPVDVTRARLRDTWPLIGVGLAVFVNAAWIGLLGYGFSKLF
jgi:hypothetical protein